MRRHHRPFRRRHAGGPGDGFRKMHKRLTGGGIYRSRDGAILGVCRGLAQQFDFSLFWTRALAVIFLLLTGFWPAIVLYLLAAQYTRLDIVAILASLYPAWTVMLSNLVYRERISRTQWLGVWVCLSAIILITT